MFAAFNIRFSENCLCKLCNQRWKYSLRYHKVSPASGDGYGKKGHDYSSVNAYSNMKI